jgi:DNA-directed RNA polymerase subunit RPC12/RpoP
MVVFPCHVCRTDLSAEDAQAGQLVRCPNCLTTLKVPGHANDQAAAALASMTAGAGVGASPQGGYGAPGVQFSPPRPPMGPAGAWGGGFTSRPAGKRYGFNCGYCSSRLEATESMAAQEGQCPTCGNNITIPILDRYGRLIDPKTRQIIKQDPHPVHAYAAAGERAPQIVRANDGKQVIRCPRCGGGSPITSNNCKGCGMPFTMEGTTLEAAGTSNGFCVASLVLGIIGLIPCTFCIPSVLALIFGIIGYNQTNKSEGGGKGMAIAGLIMAVLGFIIVALVYGRLL